MSSCKVENLNQVANAIHPGPEGARFCCVVKDNSVRLLKGNSRPINNENNRAYMLASLRSVDLVIIFDEETPKELLSIIKPSVLVKGSDYTKDQVIGREYANETIILPIIEGLSTTKILNRIRGE